MFTRIREAAATVQDLLRIYQDGDADADAYGSIEDVPLDDLGANPAAVEGDNMLLVDQPTPVRPADIEADE